MTSHNSSRQSNPIQDAQSALAQRPQTILQRISSSLSTIRLAMTPRRLWTRHPPSTRPQTAPALIRQLRPNHHRTPSHIPSTRPSRAAPEPPFIPLLSDPDPEQPCPYDSDRYHAFPNMHEPRCNFCGLRHLSGIKTTSLTWTTSRPCSGCRSGSAASHLRGRRGDGNGMGRRSRLEQGNVLSRQIGTAVTTDDRAVDGSAGMRSRVEKGEGSFRTETQTPSQLSPPPHSHQFVRRSAISAPPIGDTRPESPALHHLLLPHSKDYPYVHKHEVGPHLDALRAGSHSPLRQSPDEGFRTSRRRHKRDGDILDYTETVYYGHGRTKQTSKRIVRPNAGGRGRTVNNLFIIASYNNDIGIAHGEHGDHEGRVVEVEEDEQHAQASQSGRRGLVDRADTQDSQIVGGRRLELKGGLESEVLRLRGGDGVEEEKERCGFNSCQWVLLGPCSPSSRITGTETLPPARTVPPSRLGGLRSEGSRIAYVPTNWARHASTQLPRPQPTTSHVPSLRGGAGSPSPSTLSSTARLPPTLFWLAGGKGKPITVAGWRQSRPRKRMGALMGLAIFGRRAGMEYSGIQGSGLSEVSVAMSENSEVIEESVKSAKSARSLASLSRSIQSLRVTNGKSSPDMELQGVLDGQGVGAHGDVEEGARPSVDEE